MSAVRVWVPSSPASQHQEPGAGNPDASLFVGVAAGHDSAVHARHVCGDRGGSLDSAARQCAVCCAGSAWHSPARSRCCRGRSTGRSAPARSSVRRDTGARLHLPVCHRRTDVDEGPRWWDTAPANVPRHVVGRGADANCQVVIGVAPVFNEDRPLAHLLPHWVQLHCGARIGVRLLATTRASLLPATADGFEQRIAGSAGGVRHGPDRRAITIDGPRRQLCAGPQYWRQRDLP